ncbi:DUF1653 domain-containing protein [Rheinheimera sp.]|uniref:DUF1653 domain-containing protein n=1 Tax=Rheinheimera sp. TaxID=1869214 RepID=UPI00307E3D74
MSKAPALLAAGLYQHYKGRYYQVTDTVRHSETDEVLVLYRALYGDFGLWVRPLAMFTEQVPTDTGTKPRFAFVSADIPSALRQPSR